MKLPRDLSARELTVALGRLGYKVDRQTGSHIRLTTRQAGAHHVTIPAHDPIRIGTLTNILRDVGAHFGFGRDELLTALFA